MKVIENDQVTIYDIRDRENDNALVSDEYFVLRDNTTQPKHYFAVQKIVEGDNASYNIVSPMSKNFRDGMDMVVLLANSETSEVTEKDLFNIRSERSKKAWAKRNGGKTPAKKTPAPKTEVVVPSGLTFPADETTPATFEDKS